MTRLALLATLLIGCAAPTMQTLPSEVVQRFRAQQAPEPPVADGAAEAQAETPRESPERCEVVMQLSYASDEQHGAGARAYEMLSEEVCIKRAGGALVIPSEIALVFASADTLSYCDDAGALAIDGKSVCIWNRRFRDTFPLSIDIRVEGASGSLADYMQLVHVWRNNQLIYRWVPGTRHDDRIYIFGDNLEGTGVPHLADFDLRIYPTGIALDDSLVKREVLRKVNPLTARLKRLRDAARGSELLRSGQLGDELKCLLHLVHAQRAEVATLLGQVPPQPFEGTPQVAPPTCDTTPSTAEPSLRERYGKLKHLATSEAKDSLQQLEARVTGYFADAEAKLLPAAEKAKAELESQCADTSSPIYAACQKGQKVIGALKMVDDLVGNSLDSADEVREVLTNLRDEVAALDPKQGAKLYEAAVTELRKEGTFFQQYEPNPATTGEEAVMPMAYHDSYQFYFLSPWNGAALRLSPVGTEPGLSYAIPILDVGGIRKQFARGRWAKVQLGAGMLVFEDLLQDQSGEFRDNTRSTHNVIHFAFQTNVGIGPLRAGLGWVPAANGDFHEGLRLLVGADLYKLITGDELEVASDSD